MGNKIDEHALFFLGTTLHCRFLIKKTRNSQSEVVFITSITPVVTVNSLEVVI